MSNDLRTLAPELRNLLLNKDIIAINQDHFGIQGKRIYKVSNSYSTLQVHAKQSFIFYSKSPFLRMTEKELKYGHGLYTRHSAIDIPLQLEFWIQTWKNVQRKWLLFSTRSDLRSRKDMPFTTCLAKKILVFSTLHLLLVFLLDLQTLSYFEPFSTSTIELRSFSFTIVIRSSRQRIHILILMKNIINYIYSAIFYNFVLAFLWHIVT